MRSNRASRTSRQTAHNVTNLHLSSPGGVGGGGPTPTPPVANFYIAENGSDFYITEGGLNYVTENSI